jgi:hypothetical protein
MPFLLAAAHLHAGRPLLAQRTCSQVTPRIQHVRIQ